MFYWTVSVLYGLFTSEDLDVGPETATPDDYHTSIFFV